MSCAKGCGIAIAFVVGMGVILAATMGIATSCERRAVIEAQEPQRKAEADRIAKLKATPAAEHLRFIQSVLSDATKKFNPEQYKEAVNRAAYIPKGSDHDQAQDALKKLEDLGKAYYAQELAAKQVAEEKAHKADLVKRKREGVQVGMTAQEALWSSWGKPNHVNRTTTANGVREQWVYDGGGYLYFENGTLTSIQN